MPRDVLASEPARVRHLLRRAGFGASEQELERFTTMGLSATVEHLLNFEQTDDGALEARLSTLNLDLGTYRGLQRWWLLRMVYTQRPLQEKMVLFWHGLLTSSFERTGKGPHMHAQNALFRQHAMSDYGTLLKAVSRDPAMLIWLDSRSNKKEAPNENFARELMELFSMGVGNYTEEDVRESARAFTGWNLRKDGFQFNPAHHDFGEKTFLERRGSLDGDDVIDIIMEQPVSAEFISRKLFAFFVHDDPDDAVIARLASVFRANGRSIRSIMRELLVSDEFYSPRAYRALVKSPAELLAGTVRSLGIETDGNALPGRADLMGQSLLAPPNVAGWQGGATWINSTTLLQRVNFANDVSAARGRAMAFDPAQVAAAHGLATPEAAVDYFAGLLIDGELTAKERGVLVARVKAAAVSGTRGGLLAGSDQALRELVYLLLASPAYQVA